MNTPTIEEFKAVYEAGTTSILQLEDATFNLLSSDTFQSPDDDFLRAAAYILVGMRIMEHRQQKGA